MFTYPHADSTSPLSPSLKERPLISFACSSSSPGSTSLPGGASSRRSDTAGPFFGASSGTTAGPDTRGSSNSGQGSPLAQMWPSSRLGGGSASAGDLTPSGSGGFTLAGSQRLHPHQQNQQHQPVTLSSSSTSSSQVNTPKRDKRNFFDMHHGSADDGTGGGSVVGSGSSRALDATGATPPPHRKAYSKPQVSIEVPNENNFSFSSNSSFAAAAQSRDVTTPVDMQIGKFGTTQHPLFVGEEPDLADKTKQQQEQGGDDDAKNNSNMLLSSAVPPKALQPRRPVPSHADLKRAGLTLKYADESGLVGSCTGQVTALLVSVVTPAGCITEGEILESLHDGGSYLVRCAYPDSVLESKSEKAAKKFRYGQPRFSSPPTVPQTPATPKTGDENYVSFEDAMNSSSNNSSGDAVIRSVTPDGYTDDEIALQKQTELRTTRRFFKAVFKRRDVLPFGLQSPSVVFSRLGRHTNLGLIIGWDQTFFTYQLDQRIPVQQARSSGRRDFHGQQQQQYEIRTVSATLAELQLLPSLTRGDPRPSFRVGSHVECRRFGEFDLDEGVIVAVARDVTYSVRFKSDDVVQDGILHSDTRVLNSSRAERVGVRDRVLVGLMGAKRATVIQCYSDGRFRAVTDEGEQLLLGDSNVLSVRESIQEAVGAPKELMDLFDLLDDNFNAKVSWLKLRKELTVPGKWITPVLARLNSSRPEGFYNNQGGGAAGGSPFRATDRFGRRLSPAASGGQHTPPLLGGFHHHDHPHFGGGGRQRRSSSFALGAGAGDSPVVSRRQSLALGNYAPSQPARPVSEARARLAHHRHSLTWKDADSPEKDAMHLTPPVTSPLPENAMILTPPAALQHQRITTTLGGGGGGGSEPGTPHHQQQLVNKAAGSSSSQWSPAEKPFSAHPPPLRETDGGAGAAGRSRVGSVVTFMKSPALRDESDVSGDLTPGGGGGGGSEIDQALPRHSVQHHNVPPSSFQQARSVLLGSGGAGGGGGGGGGPPMTTESYLHMNDRKFSVLSYESLVLGRKPSGTFSTLPHRHLLHGDGSAASGSCGDSPHSTGIVSPGTLPLPLLRPNLVSVISTTRNRDTEGAQFEKELERQECMHDEVSVTLNQVFEEVNACKGIPPNAFHSGHDVPLSFREFAFIYEKVKRSLEP